MIAASVMKELDKQTHNVVQCCGQSQRRATNAQRCNKVDATTSKLQRCSLQHLHKIDITTSNSQQWIVNLPSQRRYYNVAPTLHQFCEERQT